MSRFTALLSILTSAAAFAPMGRTASSSALKMSFSSELGAQPPLGFWDPLNILEYADEERFERLRFVENKHGRISMLAILGHLVTTAGVRLPGEVAYGLGFDQSSSRPGTRVDVRAPRTKVERDHGKLK